MPGIQSTRYFNPTERSSPFEGGLIYTKPLDVSRIEHRRTGSRPGFNCPARSPDKTGRQAAFLSNIQDQRPITPRRLDLDQAPIQGFTEDTDTLFERLTRLTQTHSARLELRRAFLIFFNGVLSHRGLLLTPQTLNDLTEAHTMFSRIFEGIDPARGQEAYQYVLKLREERKKLREEVLNEVREEVLNEVREEVRNEVREEVLNEVREGEARARQQSALQIALNLLVARFDADEGQWLARLANHDEAQLNAFILRTVSATSLTELEP